MRTMIVPSDFYIGFLKCKRCKYEFKVSNEYTYEKTVNFCPYCGQPRIKQRKERNERDEEE